MTNGTASTAVAGARAGPSVRRVISGETAVAKRCNSKTADNGGDDTSDGTVNVHIQLTRIFIFLFFDFLCGKFEWRLYTKQSLHDTTCGAAESKQKTNEIRRPCERVPSPLPL